VETLYDDRLESPGVKFNDADLLGLPLRLTVSERALNQGGVEFKRRDQDEKKVVPLDRIVLQVQAELRSLLADIEQAVVSVPME
jgi:prolyl-tRNA synthetase